MDEIWCWSVSRAVEDKHFVTGTGCYTDDVIPGSGLRVGFLRSPSAHARLQNLDYSAAVSAPGIRVVSSQADLDAEQVGDIYCQLKISNFDDSKMPMTTKPAMVRDINRNAGDNVAMVAADSQIQADDAVELIEASFDPMPAVADIYAAMADSAPQLCDCYKNNILGIKGLGEAGAIGAPQAVVGAVDDELNIRHVDMPVTPKKIFDILNNRQAGTEAE